MSDTETNPVNLNIPNSLTALRLVLSVVMFVALALDAYWTATVLFVVAAGTDWMDGYWARKYHQVTTLGRIIDPFADKVIICGTFVFLAAEPLMAAVPWGLRAWMVVVIVSRELLVTALRGLLEQRGRDFSAKMSGKLKMVLQCVSAVACLVYLAYAGPAFTGSAAASSPLPAEAGSLAPDWVWLTLVVSTWAAVVLTIHSGLIYIIAAARMLRGR